MKNYDDFTKGIVWGTIIFIISILMICGGTAKNVNERMFYECIGLLSLAISAHWIWKK